jgi:5-methylcytosine-specific restriction endonuclease McrA
MKRRAREHGQQLDFAECELYALAKAEPDCDFCGEPLATADLSIDHCIAVSRGGAFTKANLAVVHDSCNRSKGVLSADQFDDLLEMMNKWKDPISKQDVLTRLKLGAALKHGWRPRRKRYSSKRFR